MLSQTTNSLFLYEITEIIDDSLIQLIQVPGNIFNQDILLSKELNEFEKNGGEIHIRSVFVQGLILMHSNKIPKKFEKFKQAINIFQNISKELSVDPAILAISCVKYIIPKSKIVLGFDNIEQLKILNDIEKLEISDSDILEVINFGKKYRNKFWDPRMWNT